MITMSAVSRPPDWHWAGVRGLVEAADRIGPSFRRVLKDVAPIGDPLNDLTPGRLMRSIRYSRTTTGHAVRMEFTAHTPYAGYVLGGTRPHIIEAVAARSLRWNTIAGPRFARRVHHPGTRANDFPARALASRRDQILHEIAQGVRGG